MSAPRMTLHTSPRTDDARLARAAGWRQLPEPVRVRMRQRAPRPSMVVAATAPYKPHGSDVPFQMVDLAHAAGATCADAMAYGRGLISYTLRRFRSSLRSVGVMLSAARIDDARFEIELTHALADGRLTSGEERAVAHLARQLAGSLEELAATLDADADTQERGGPAA